MKPKIEDLRRVLSAAPRRKKGERNIKEVDWISRVYRRPYRYAPRRQSWLSTDLEGLCRCREDRADEGDVDEDGNATKEAVDRRCRWQYKCCQYNLMWPDERRVIDKILRSVGAPNQRLKFFFPLGHPATSPVQTMFFSPSRVHLWWEDPLKNKWRTELELKETNYIGQLNAYFSESVAPTHLGDPRWLDGGGTSHVRDPRYLELLRRSEISLKLLPGDFVPTPVELERGTVRIPLGADPSGFFVPFKTKLRANFIALRQCLDALYPLKSKTTRPLFGVASYIKCPVVRARVERDFARLEQGSDEGLGIDWADFEKPVYLQAHFESEAIDFKLMNREDENREKEEAGKPVLDHISFGPFRHRVCEFDDGELEASDHLNGNPNLLSDAQLNALGFLRRPRMDGSSVDFGPCDYCFMDWHTSFKCRDKKRVDVNKLLIGCGPRCVGCWAFSCKDGLCPLIFGGVSRRVKRNLPKYPRGLVDADFEAPPHSDGTNPLWSVPIRVELYLSPVEAKRRRRAQLGRLDRRRALKKRRSPARLVLGKCMRHARFLVALRALRAA